MRTNRMGGRVVMATSVLAASLVALATQCSSGDSTDEGATSGTLSSGSGGETAGTGGGHGNPSGASTVTSGTTSTGSSTEGPFTFLAYGDTRAGGGCEGNAAHIALVSMMESEPSWDFVVHLGDMTTGYDASTCFDAMGDCTSPDSQGDFAQIIAGLKNHPAPSGLPTAFFPVIGNHDDNEEWYPDPCGGRICDVFDMPSLINHPTPHGDPCNADYPDQAYYSFRYKGVLFVVLHVNSDYFDLFECNNPQDPFTSCSDYCENAPPSPERSDECYNVHQYDWLKSELASAATDPTIAHKVILMHAPIYTSYDDHSPVTSSPIITKLVDEYGVDLVLNGHNHTYERTVPIKGGAAARGGAVYVTTGHGGSEGGAPETDWFTAASSGEYHYLRLKVDGPTISGTAIGIDGNVLDAF